MKIQSKVTTIVIISSVFISIILHSMYVYNQFKRLKEELDHKMEHHSQLLGNIIAGPAYNYDTETITRVINSFVQDRDIVSISVSDFLSDKNISTESSEVSESGLIRNKISINYNDNEIGLITMIFSADSINHELKIYIRQAIISLTIISYIQFILLYITIKNIVDPVKYLTKITKEISEGNLKKEIFIKNNDELGELATSFSKMQDSINKRTLELENHKLHLEEMVDIRTRELEKTQKILAESEKMASLTGLVAGIAHEINTPIGIGITAASHLEEETLLFKEGYDSGQVSRTKFAAYLDIIARSSKIILSSLNRTSDTIESFKEIVIDHTNGIESDFEVLSLVKGVIKKIESIYINSSVEVKYHADNQGLKIKCDPAVISKIITILYINSIQHGFINNNGLVDIEIKSSGSDLVLDYKDNGEGIEKDNLNRIFDPFFTTSRGNKNVGLGLSILYNIVTVSLKGTVHCHSDEGQGVAFNISLPGIVLS